MSIPLQFSFKGDRRYVHGTDIYDQAIPKLLEFLSTPHQVKIRMAIHTQLHSQGDLIIALTGENLPKNRVADFTLSTAETSIKATLVERDERIAKKKAYNEEPLARITRVHDVSAELIAPSPYTPIETIVGITKILHYSKRPSAGGQWVFVQLDLERPLSTIDTEGLAVSLQGRPSRRLSRSSIKNRGEFLGYIDFSYKT